ncbi:uncharacterized protein LOC126819431 isoform X1 [Patella vulgata]|uniref:uncharacterized protein LOC126819431 isoform X1 n=1 Tax=Patella vulgata TaxID=6465 RepID=UPI0021808F5A|nr:uncharacterized protein LOC126819431 isoform X1 [Patella vulgata]
MKPKNGRTTNQDYVNLLYSESDSDPPDLKLPPLNKSKKSRKKSRGLPFKTPSDEIIVSHCSVGTFLKIVVVLFLLASVSVLGVLSVWLMRQVTELKNHLDLVESQNKQGGGDVVKLQTDLSSINKSLETYKLHNTKLQTNLTNLDSKYKTLIDTSSNLQKSLENIKNLEKLSEIETLTRTLAAYGSDFKNWKKDLTAKTDDIIKRLTSLETANKGDIKKSESSMTSNPSSTPEIAHLQQQIESLSHDIDEMNTTLLHKYDYLNTTITQKVSLLENSTLKLIQEINSKAAGSSSPAVETRIQDGVKDKDINGTGGVGSLSNLTALVYNLQSNLSQLQTDHSMFYNINHTIDELRTQTTSSIQSLNVTVVKMNKEVDQLFNKLTNNTNKLHRVDKTVEGIKQYLGAKDNITSSSSLSTATLSSPITTPVTSTIPLSTTESSKLIKIPNITTYDELKTKYNQWTARNQNQPIKLDDLQSFMKESSIPSSDAMEPYDKDNSGTYSLEEFSNALGLHPVTESDVPPDMN